MLNTFRLNCFSTVLFSLAFLMPLSADAQKETQKQEQMDLNFSSNCNGFVGDFADYPVTHEAFFELSWGWDTLPTEISSSKTLLQKGLYLSGYNHSDDLWMFVKRKVEGLKKNTVYKVAFSVLLETDVPSGQAGAGGSPGEDVFVKVGASTSEPTKKEKEGYYRLDADKGNQAQGGKEAIVIGDMANPLVNPEERKYEPKQLSSHIPLSVKTDNEGSFWIFIGTDSGFEGITKFYLAEVLLDIKCDEQGDSSSR